MKKSLILTIIVSTYLLLIVKQNSAQNIGINGTGGLAHSSALLDVDAVATPSLGILIPRIALQAINLATPIASPAASLLLYNTATASTGTNAVSPGYYYWDGIKWIRFQMANSGSSSTSWDILGNAGTVDGTNFIGTTDNIPFNIRVNNQKAGKIDHLTGSNFYGYLSGNVNTGSWNVGSGYNALMANTNGALNTATGSNSLRTNTTGSGNTGNGYGALYSNTTGSDNTGIGAQSMYNNTTGYKNTGVGEQALYNNITGINNTSIGLQSLYTNTTGSLNVASGSNSLYNNTIGSYNTAIGFVALQNNTIGNLNSSFGYYSGITNSTGIGNTFLGANADASTGTFTNATAIGYNAKVGASNALVLGGTGGEAVNVGIGMTTPLYPLQVINTNAVTPTAYFENTGTNNRAIRAINTAASSAGSGDGLYASTSQAIGNGVYARNLNTSGTGILAIGQNVIGSYLPAGSGVSASGDASGLVADADNATGTGIRAMGNSIGSYPALVAGSGGAFAGIDIGVYGIGNKFAVASDNVAGGYFNNGNNSYAYVGYTTGGTSFKINGVGTVSTIVKNTKNELVNLYCPEAPEVLFQDFGKGTLVNGAAHIALDETFIKNVRINEKHPLRVIIQLEGDCKGVYVTNKTSNGFEVKELQGGNSNVAFTYFVTANRADAYNEDGSLFSKFEDVRFGEAPAKATTKDEPKVAVEKK